MGRMPAWFSPVLMIYLLQPPHLALTAPAAHLLLQIPLCGMGWVLSGWDSPTTIPTLEVTPFPAWCWWAEHHHPGERQSLSLGASLLPLQLLFS